MSMMDEESILGNPQQRRNSLNTAVPEFPEFTPYDSEKGMANAAFTAWRQRLVIFSAGGCVLQSMCQLCVRVWEYSAPTSISWTLSKTTKPPLQSPKLHFPMFPSLHKGAIDRKTLKNAGTIEKHLIIILVIQTSKFLTKAGSKSQYSLFRRAPTARHSLSSHPGRRFPCKHRCCLS
jgi:hypothetical protein